MQLKLKTLTPIWTGDIDRNSSKLKESSVIGSLRWWCEGIVRGMGGYACIAVQNGSQPCLVGPDIKAADDLCPACQLFGCTGWARRFRLSSGEMQSFPLFFISHQQAYIGNANWLYRMFGGSDLGGSKEKRGKDWQLSFGVHTLWSDEFSLEVLPRFAASEDTTNMLAYLFSIIASYGALGAKAQNGFGLVKLLGGASESSIKQGRARLLELSKQSRANGKQQDGWLFNLQDTFIRHYEIKDPAPYQGVGRVIGSPQPKVYPSRLIPIAFDIRYKSSSKNPFTGQGRDFGLRPFLKQRLGPKAVNLLLGETRPRNDDARSASRICVSHLFRESQTERYKLRIWGTVPPAVSKSFPEVTKERVAQEVDEFVCGSNGMFPGSSVQPVDVSKEILRP